MTRKAGLGRGLGALLPGAATEDVAAASGLVEIEVEEIHPNPRQPRTEFAQEELEELASSIRELGVLQPVVVRPRAQGGYELLVGERRLRASRLAGARRVPAIVREADDRQALEQALVENVQRQDLHALEEANAYRNLVELFELTQEEAARRVGKSRVHVTNTLRLLELPDEIKSLLAEGRLQAGHARALLAIKEPDERLTVARRAAEEGLTVRQIEAIARGDETPATDDTTPASRAGRARKQGAFPDLEESLADHLGTEVRIESGRGRGRIVVSFGSRDDLHRIVELLLGY